MISRVHSSILEGIDAIGCEVEADVARRGLGELKLVGLAETAVKESVSRIQAALRNSGYRWPGPKVTINLAPADVKKDSAAFDLPIAVAVMLAGGMFASEKIDDYLLAGELARALGEAHRHYTRRVNFREGWRGYLWQGRFASLVMDEPHLMAATRYVETNPVRAGLVARAEGWPWSSAGAHVAGKADALADSAWLAERTAGWVCSWREYLRQDDDSHTAARLRRRESTGRPLGDESFLRKIGRLLGRDLLPKRPGPVPKKAKRKQR